MTSKECVRRVIDREPAPYVPLGFYVVDHDTVEAVIGRETYVRNKIKSRVALWEGRRDEVVESYKKDTVEFYQKIDCCDIVTFKEAPRVPPKDYDPPKVKQLGDATWEDDEGRIWKASDLTNDISVVHVPEELQRREAKLEDYEGPLEVVEPDPSVYEACDYIVEHLGADRYNRRDNRRVHGHESSPRRIGRPARLLPSTGSR